MHKTNWINITNKLYSKDIFVKLYNKTLRQRYTVKVWRNGLFYLILPPDYFNQTYWPIPFLAK